MFRIPLNCTIALLIACTALAGCGGRGTPSGGGGTPPGTAPIVLTMTDTPPTNVSILSAEVTLTGVTLNPGNVSVFSGSRTVELTRLQTDIAYIGTTLVPPGNYNGTITLTFSNPMLTIENDTGSSLATGGSNPPCAAGAICTIHSVATNLSTTITLSPILAVSPTTGAGLLVDVNLNNLLSATLGADFINGVSISQFTPAGSAAPPVGAEDVVGNVTSTDPTHSKFLLQDGLGARTLVVDNTTTFLHFPAGTCTTFSIACVQANQILSVDISFRTDGTVVARNVLFEDADSSDIEVEGIITKTGSLTFNMIALAESTAIPSLPIDSLTTVTFTGLTPSDVDFTHADSTAMDTSAIPFSISVPTDVIVGQQVLVRRNPSSSGTSITADRVRLRSTRVTGTITSVGAPFFQLGSLPSIFVPRGTAVIQAQTFAPTIYAGTAIGFSTLAVNHVASVRGPLFANSGSPTLVATKVLQH